MPAYKPTFTRQSIPLSKELVKNLHLIHRFLLVYPPDKIAERLDKFTLCITSKEEMNNLTPAERGELLVQLKKLIELSNALKVIDEKASVVMPKF